VNLHRIRVDKYDTFKHPFFIDKVLANKHLWKLYKEGKITKLDVGQVLEASEFYVDWLEKKIFEVEEKNKELDELAPPTTE